MHGFADGNMSASPREGRKRVLRFHDNLLLLTMQSSDVFSLVDADGGKDLRMLVGCGACSCDMK